MNGDLLFFEKTERLFFTSDTHFGHRNIIKYCERPFSCIEEMDDALIANWNRVVGKDDIIFHLGDFAMGGSAEWSRLLHKLNGRIYLILGNHELINVKGQRIYLNHYPFLCYGGAYRNTWQLYGHVHTGPANRGLDAPRLKMMLPTQYDVGVDNNNYIPVSFEQVKRSIRKQIELSSTEE